MPEPQAPEDGFEFIPDTYRIVVAERDSLKLRIQVDGSTGIAVGDKIEISCDNPNIKILDDRPVVPKLYHEDPPLALVHVSVEGLQANPEGFVTAKHGAKSAIAAIEVVSTKVQKQHQPTGGLFEEFVTRKGRISLLDRGLIRKKALYGSIPWGPSIDLYFGRGGEGQENAPNQALVAELVTEHACQEIARRKREAKILDIPPGVEELDAYNAHLTKLKAEYAAPIHKVLVSKENREKTDSASLRSG